MKNHFLLKMLFVILLLSILQINCISTKAENSKTRTIKKDKYTIKLDLSTQILGLDIVDDKIYDTGDNKLDVKLYPSIKHIPENKLNFISTSLLIAKAKQFDDGLYATVELLCQNGAGKFISKKQILNKLYQILDNKNYEDKQAAAYCKGLINTAANLGGQQFKISNNIKQISKTIGSDFIKNSLRSKPISFYTWNENLTSIFQQDRLLQTVLDSPEKIRIIGNAIAADENNKAAYGSYLSLVKQLTNSYPQEYRDLSKINEIKSDCKYCFFPPSQSPESELIKELYGNKTIPADFSLIDTLIRKIKTEQISLEPKSESGWYDYLLYALEPFVIPDKMPEAEHLYFTEKYKNELLNQFKAALALTRETHIKQLEIPMAGAAMPLPVIDIYPEISIEPNASFSLRRARSYTFVKRLLETTFGKEVLKKSYRLTSTGKVSKDLMNELNEMESLFYGIFQITAHEVGMNTESQLMNRTAIQQQNDENLASNWIDSITNDKDLALDNRMMVPVYYDLEKQETRVWIMLGYAIKPVEIFFKQKPKASVFDKNNNKTDVELKFTSVTKDLIYPVSAELGVRKLLDRKEFQDLCDKYKTQTKILQVLED